MSNVGDRSLFVVGDDAQSIYGFRGSKIELILNFHAIYPHTKEIILNQNYRSTQPILNLSEKILEHNPHQKKKGLFTQKEDTQQVEYYLAHNERDEAEFIVRKLAEIYLDQKNNSAQSTLQSDELEVTLVSDDDPIASMFAVYDSQLNNDFGECSNNFSLPRYTPSVQHDWSQVDKLNSTVILYRTHSQSRAFEEAFLKHGLPYRLVSGTKFLDRKEVKDVISILRYISNGEDHISLTRWFPLVHDGVGAKSIQQIIAYLADPDYPIKEKLKTSITNTQTTIVDCIANHTTIVDFAKDLLEKLGYLHYLRKEYPDKEEYMSRLENIGEVYSLMAKYDQQSEVSLVEKIQLFLQDISLMTNQDSTEDNQPKINLMSLHQSKGLEYETVFLVGLEDGILPHLNSLYEQDGMDEEVRLAYVGVTRAKQNLYLLSAQSRIQFGHVQANPVSRIFKPFLTDYAKRVFY